MEAQRRLDHRSPPGIGLQRSKLRTFRLAMGLIATLLAMACAPPPRPVNSGEAAAPQQPPKLKRVVAAILGDPERDVLRAGNLDVGGCEMHAVRGVALGIAAGQKPGRRDDADLVVPAGRP